nr:unnamed protein product [Spirometra erinaceieuropaei]
MADFKKKMIRVLIRDCHARIHKYRQMIEHHPSTCQSIFTAHELEILKAAILDSARRHRQLLDGQLSRKFEKISPPKQTSADGALVHNLSSPRFTQQQLAVLSYDAKFSTRDAQPEDFIASFESALQKCEADEECKNGMRQQVSTLLLQHKRQMTISKAEDRELLKIRKMKDIVTLPADKGRSTVVMDKAEYCTKLGNLLMDKEAYAPSTVSEFKKLEQPTGRRTALVARALARYVVDIPALSETRFSEQDQLEEVGAGYSFFWNGRSKVEGRDAGVAFDIRNNIVGQLTCLPQGINDPLMSLRLPLWGGNSPPPPSSSTLA